MIRKICVIVLLLLTKTPLQAKTTTQKSISGNLHSYRKVCKKAATNDVFFRNFRSIQSYMNIVDTVGGELANDFANYIKSNASSKTLSLLPEFRKLDLYGNPIRNDIPGFGLFSGTTLRYVLVADHISRLFNLPKDYTVVEIGAGFGGQASILFQLLPFSRYYVYDLPEVEMLIEKMMSTLSLNNVSCLDPHEELPLENIDLFISNYALSECDRETQLDYFKRVVVKAKRGYILFNDINPFDHLTLSDFVELLRSHGIHPTIHQEPVHTGRGNVLITWDRTNS
jgi:putative sugar O-methyltransferase